MPQDGSATDSFVVKIPFELKGLWSVSYYINHSIPLQAFPHLEVFYVVQAFEDKSSNENRLDINSAVSMSYPPYGSMLQGSAEMYFKAHPTTQRTAKTMRLAVKNVMEMNLGHFILSMKRKDVVREL